MLSPTLSSLANLPDQAAVTNLDFTNASQAFMLFGGLIVVNSLEVLTSYFTYKAEMYKSKQTKRKTKKKRKKR